MPKKGIIKYAFLNALGTAGYIAAVASFIYFLGRFFGETEPKSVFAPIAILMLFVFSAAFTGSLVFGRPIIWYLNGEKKEAISLLACTLGILLVIIVVVFLLFIMLVW